jgi:hypothetical protein
MLQTSQSSAYETTWILQQETHWECGSQFTVACLLHENMTWMPLIQDHLVFFNCQMEDQLLMMLVSKHPVCSASVQLHLATSTTHPWTQPQFLHFRHMHA